MKHLSTDFLNAVAFFVVTILLTADSSKIDFEDNPILRTGNDRFENIMTQTCNFYQDDETCGDIPPLNETRASAETFIFADVREKAAANAGTWWGSIFRTQAASHAKMMRKKCQTKRVAIFVAGGSGSGKDALEPRWRSLIDPDCGFVYINFNNIVTGAHNFTAGQRAWKKAFRKYGQCAQYFYAVKGGIIKWTTDFVEKAIEEGHSFVYDGTMSRTRKFGDAWKAKIANLTLPGKPHTVHFFGTSSDMAESAIRLWNRGIGRLPPGPDAEIGIFLSLCFIYTTHVRFSKYFYDDFSKWDNVQLYHKTAETDYKLGIIFKKEKNQIVSPIMNTSLYAKFLKIAETTPYEFEKAIKESPEGKKRNILQRYKELNRDCGFCACDVYSFEMSERSKPPMNYTGEGDLTGLDTCYDRLTKETDCSSRVRSCASTADIFKCPKLCGLCYDMNNGKCNVSLTIDSSVDVTKSGGVITGIVNAFWQAKSKLSNLVFSQTTAAELVFKPSITEGEIYLSFYPSPGEVDDAMLSLWQMLDREGYRVWKRKSAITSRVKAIDLGTDINSLFNMSAAMDSVTDTANAVDKSVLVIIGVSKPYLTDSHKILELQYVLQLQKPFLVVSLEDYYTASAGQIFRAFGKNVGKFGILGEGALNDSWPDIKEEIEMLSAKFGLNAKKVSSTVKT